MNLAKQNAGTWKAPSNGFTLVELMIVVAIIGILAGLAYPSYSQYVARGKITEAHSLLADYRIKIEQYYQDHRTYVDGGTCGGAAPTSKYFTFSCENVTSTTYTAEATSVSGLGLGAGGDYTFTIDQSNGKATPKFKGNTVNKSCWLVKGDEC